MVTRMTAEDQTTIQQACRDHERYLSRTYRGGYQFSADHFFGCHKGTFQSVPRYPIPGTIELADFVALIATEFLDGEYRRFIVVGIDRRGALLPRVEVIALRFPSMSWVIEHWGSRGAIASGKKTSLAVATMKLSDEINDALYACPSLDDRVEGVE